MSCRQMKHRSVIQKKTERKAPNNSCGSIGPEKCMRIGRSFYMFTSHREIYRIERKRRDVVYSKNHKRAGNGGS